MADPSESVRQTTEVPLWVASAAQNVSVASVKVIVTPGESAKSSPSSARGVA